MKINILDHGYVEFIESWGSDERIIEAARMSTNKGFQGWGLDHDIECPNYNDKTTPVCSRCGTIVGDEKLLRYLYTHKHMTPFEMAGMVIEVQAPIFVFREWHRHRTQSYNELSARYTELPDLSYIPSLDRVANGGQSKSNKQASGEPLGAITTDLIRFEIGQATTAARISYNRLLELGVAKEIARLVIPVNQYSRMRASASLRNWLQFLELRMAEGAQWEIRQYANAVAEVVKDRFPRTYALFDECRKDD